MTYVPPGYPLPAGVLGNDEIVCQLVYLPDRAEYWQALYSAIGYFATWKAWHRGDDKRGKDAASDWRTALELTTECWRMTCLSDITDRMDIMIDLLGNQPGCCGATTIGPIITVVTNIEPGVGDDPTEWGETEVEDWAEWNEYICYHAHRYVDSLIESAKVLDFAVSLGNYTIEVLRLMHAGLNYIWEGTPVGLGRVMEIYQGFIDGVDLVSEFDGLADKFEAARQDIVCAIVQGGSLSDEVEDAIDNNIVWLLFYVFTDYGGLQAIIYEGTIDGTEYLAPVKRDDCDTCGFEQQGEGDLFIEEVIGTSWGYDSGTKEWTAQAVPSSSCRRIEFNVWETASKITRKQVRIVLTSCDGASTCGGAKHSIGIVQPDTEWEFDHPRLPAISDAPIDRFVKLHPPVQQFIITWKLYV